MKSEQQQELERLRRERKRVTTERDNVYAKLYRIQFAADRPGQLQTVSGER